MKFSFVPASVLAIAALFSASCHEPREIPMSEVYKLQDAVPAIIPTAKSIQAKVEERVHVLLIVGDERFYNASPQQRQEAAIKAGQQVLAIFGTDIQAGELILSKEIRQQADKPADGLVSDMKIDSLKKAMGAK